MGRMLRVEEVRLDGTEVPHIWTFPEGVTVIVGAVGGGKTSLLNLIKFGFGGDVPITAEITQAASGVALGVQAGSRHLELTRGFNKQFVMVREGDSPARRYALKRGAKDPWLSDLLLDALGIPAIRVRQSRTGRSTRITSVSFLDVFAYCYLDQEQVDRSTVFDDQPFLGPKRLWTFELLHGLIDRELADLEVSSLRHREELESRQQRIGAVENFAQEKGLSLTSKLIEARLVEIDHQQQQLTEELVVAHRNAAQAVTIATGLEDDAARLEQQLLFAQDEHSRITVELEGVRRAVNQLERDLVTLEQGEVARAALEPLPYEVCPRCEQRLDIRPHAAGQCQVCLQPDPPAVIADGEETIRRVRAQLDDTRALTSRLTGAREVAAAAVSDLGVRLRGRRDEIRQLTVAAAAPHLESATHLREQLGALRGERTALIEAQPLTEAVVVEHRELSAIEPAIAELQDRATEHRKSLAPAHERVEELSQEFNEILRRFTLPWLDTAEVDPDSYLPRVNGRSLRQLSSGGMKATTNVAYYLAVLVTALRDREILTPSFLILDGFRKDYGGDEKDLARAGRIYEYLRTLQDARNIPGALGADFQLIVVDNDLPHRFRQAFNTIHIDPDRPLIRFP